MNLPRVLPLRTERPSAHRPWLLLCAVAVAIGLLALYVNLLHESIARGAQMREVQRSAPVQTFAKAGDSLNLQSKR